MFDVRDRHVGVTLKADVPDDTHDDAIVGAASTPAPTGTSARRGRCSASTSTAIPDLRHIYLPTEFEGHPLRKDFPLLARVVKPWPGIVDVEPMPGEPDEAEAATRRATAPDAARALSVALA